MAEGKRYYWLKLHKDFFKSKRIKKLRGLAGGDTYTIIYLKMQLLSLEDSGQLYFTGLEKTFAEELALDLDEKPDDVGIVCNYLLTVGLLEKISEEIYVLPFVKECIGTETDWAVRKRLQRTQDGHSMDNVPQLSNNCPSEIEIDIEKEKELDKEIDILPPNPPHSVQAVIDAYNTYCVSFPRVQKVTASRAKTIAARLKSYTAEELNELFKKAERTPFLKGDNDRGWKANFDWLLNESNMTKVLEGYYDGLGHGSKAERNVGRTYDALRGFMESEVKF